MFEKMNSICIMFLLVIPVCLGDSETVDQHCRSKEGASEDDARFMTDHRAPETRVQKCFFDCVYQQAGFSDGKRFLKEGFLQKATESATNENSQKMLEETANRCDGLEHEDRCELAAEIDACFFNRK